MKRRVAILISGRGSNMSALIDAAKAADFPAEIVDEGTWGNMCHEGHAGENALLSTCHIRLVR